MCIPKWNINTKQIAGRSQVAQQTETRNVCVALVCPAKRRAHGAPVNWLPLRTDTTKTVCSAKAWYKKGKCCFDVRLLLYMYAAMKRASCDLTFADIQSCKWGLGRNNHFTFAEKECPQRASTPNPVGEFPARGRRRKLIQIHGKETSERINVWKVKNVWTQRSPPQRNQRGCTL